MRVRRPADHDGLMANPPLWPEWSPVAEATKPVQPVCVENDSDSLALRVIAGLLVVGAAWAAAQLLVPFVLAFILAVALSPLASLLERRGVPKALASLACTLALAALIVGVVGLLVYEAGTIVNDSDRYIKRFGSLIDDVARRTHLEQAAREFGFADRDETSAKGTDQGDGQKSAGGEELVRRALAVLVRWAASGVGGLLGVIGGGVVFLASLFYMLEGREGWLESITEALRRLGMRPSPDRLDAVRRQMVRYLSVLAMVACAYVLIVSLVLWLIGVPQPVLWGLLAGMFEVVPYFGPLIASVMPTIVALSLDAWWKPAAVAGMFLTLHLVEGYFISPVLYGKAVRLDPVTILFGTLFFGGLWGPIGLAIATPMMIVLRGLLVIAPDTPALDALADVKAEKATVSVGNGA
jgi:predicted PurR-regulated permease PerM